MDGRNKLPKRLLWIDLEMTGLDPEVDKIIEVGVIVTDFDFNEIETYETVIKQDLDKLTLDPWITENLAGLLKQVPGGKDEQEVVADLCKIVDKNFEYSAILAGNSIHQDRRFIRKWWPDLEAKLHYRMLDVSSFKIWMMGKHGTIFHKPEQHRALEDIRGSIQELKMYIKGSNL